MCLYLLVFKPVSRDEHRSAEVNNTRSASCGGAQRRAHCPRPRAGVVNAGASSRDRTGDLILTMDALYLLSYRGVFTARGSITQRKMCINKPYGYRKK